MSLEPLQDLEPGDPRHVDVEEHELGLRIGLAVGEWAFAAKIVDRILPIAEPQQTAANPGLFQGAAREKLIIVAIINQKNGTNGFHAKRRSIVPGPNAIYNGKGVGPCTTPSKAGFDMLSRALYGDSMTAEPVAHIYLDAAGVAWIDDTRIKVVEVALDHLAYGWSAEEMAAATADSPLRRRLRLLRKQSA